jgi:hypothetical protein
MLRRSLFKTLFSLPFISNISVKAEEPKEIYHPIVEWAEKNFYITNLNTGRGLIKLYPYQKRVLTDWMTPGCLKTWVGCRQSGKTTLGLIQACYKTDVLNYARPQMIFVSNGVMQRHIMQKLREQYDGRIKSFTRENITLSSGKRILVYIPTVDACCGLAINTVFFDEIDHMNRQKNIDELLKATIPTLSCTRNSRLIMASSLSEIPNTAFKQFITHSKPIYTTWNDIPGRNKKWKQTMLSLLNNKGLFNLEYENRLT